MNISKLLRELIVISPVAVVVACLPEGSAASHIFHACASHHPRRRTFQRLQCPCKRAAFRLTEQKMNMLGHQNKPEHAESVPSARVLQRAQHSRAGLTVRQVLHPPIARKCDEERVSGLLQSHETCGHLLQATLFSKSVTIATVPLDAARPITAPELELRQLWAACPHGICTPIWSGLSFILVHPDSPLRVLRGSRQEFLGWTPGFVKLRVPPRQSRGNSHFIRETVTAAFQDSV